VGLRWLYLTPVRRELISLANFRPVNGPVTPTGVAGYFLPKQI
jgi:hypothetical protein